VRSSSWNSPRSSFPITPEREGQATPSAASTSSIQSVAPSSPRIPIALARDPWRPCHRSRCSTTAGAGCSDSRRDARARHDREGGEREPPSRDLRAGGRPRSYRPNRRRTSHEIQRSGGSDDLKRSNLVRS
jgi:hypothetical protein